MSSVLSLRSFGGGTLRNGAPVRFAHVDEAGTSNNEQFCVVAGVVSHPDRQWMALNQALKDLAKEFVPAAERDKTIFHAKDIWHGSKRFNRDIWPREKRMALLERLADLPLAHSLPVIGSPLDKAQPSWEGVKHGSQQWQGWNYSLAFGLCAIHFEYVLRSMCAEHELGTIIAEDAPAMRAHAKEGYRILSDPHVTWQTSPGIESYMPLARIVEQPLFCAKDESSILQIADLIAFTLARRLNGHDDVQPLINRFASQFVILPHQRG